MAKTFNGSKAMHVHLMLAEYVDNVEATPKPPHIAASLLYIQAVRLEQRLSEDECMKWDCDDYLHFDKVRKIRYRAAKRTDRRKEKADKLKEV